MMQDSPLSRWLTPIMAFCLTFIIIATLAPVLGIQIDRQINFWLLWLVSMIVLALPICYLEVALAKRSGATALKALSSLTRDADASMKWRLVGWLSVVFIPFLAGAILSNSNTILIASTDLNISLHIGFLILLVCAFGLSFIPRQFLIIAMIIAIVISFISANVMGSHLMAWHWVPIEFKQWGSVTVLALTASGLGMGLYWQNSLLAIQNNQQASRTALPIWIAQILAVFVFGFYAAQTNIPVITLLIASLMAAALLLQLAREQLVQRQVPVALLWVILVVASLLWLIPNVQNELNLLLMLWGLLICLIYSIFTGWIMKISHLRKSINFSNEVIYNIWRIAIRIILPLAIILAMCAVIGRLFT